MDAERETAPLRADLEQHLYRYDQAIRAAKQTLFEWRGATDEQRGTILAALLLGETLAELLRSRGET